MSKNISNKKVIELASRVNIEPSENFITEIKKEFEKNSDVLMEKAALKKEFSMSKKIALAASAFCIALVLGIIIKTNSDSTTASADEGYSFVKYEANSTTDVSDEFAENQIKSAEMLTSFLKNLPYKGRYKASEAAGTYTVDLISADQFPDYYAGSYINEDGKLIVQIKESYYEKKYRRCDWYKELAEMMKSNDFACHPVKYNYTELINGMSDITQGDLSERLKKDGIEIGSETESDIAGVGLNDYLNCIEIEVRREEKADMIKEIVNNEMYSIVVVGDVVVRDN